MNTLIKIMAIIQQILLICSLTHFKKLKITINHPRKWGELFLFLTFFIPGFLIK